MIVSTGRRYVFVHIPKTGGTALTLALEARAMKDDILIGDTPKAKRRRNRLKGAQTRGRLWKHSTLADIDGLIAPETLQGLFAFTLVRNPWDRAVSYYHWLRTQTFDHPAVARARKLDFNPFVLHPETRAAFHASPARSYMQTATGREQANLYIRLEHFHEDGAPLFDHLGFVPDMQPANRSERKTDWRGYFTDESTEAVASCCAEDIARFNYHFDPD